MTTRDMFYDCSFFQASPFYSGKCPFLVNTSKWSSHEKQAFGKSDMCGYNTDSNEVVFSIETNCDVSFPCKVSDVDAL